MTIIESTELFIIKILISLIIFQNKNENAIISINIIFSLTTLNLV